MLFTAARLREIRDPMQKTDALNMLKISVWSKNARRVSVVAFHPKIKT